MPLYLVLPYHILNEITKLYDGHCGGIVAK